MINAKRFPIYGPACLGDQPYVFQFADAMMLAAQEAGIVPKDRAPLAADSRVVWVEDNGTAAVAVYFECGHARVWLDFIFVEPRYRRKGYACGLMRRIGEVAALGGMRKIMLGTGMENEAMRRCAQAAGFLSDHVVMAKAVPAPVNQLVLSESMGNR